MDLDLVTQRLLSMGSDNPNLISNLYHHLSRVVPQLSAFQQDKIAPISNLEYISEYIKKYTFKPTSPLNEQQLHSFLNLQPQLPHWLKHQEKLFNNDKKPKEQLKAQLIGQLKGKTVIGAVIIDNFDQHSTRLFDPVSVGFGKEESRVIHQSLLKLAIEKKADRVRFWGKILTKSKDYFVAEGSTNYSNTGEPFSPDTEPLGQGINYNTYWVTQNIYEAEWYQLPLLSPAQMQASRSIKQIFHGQLNRPVETSPPFPGLEKHLLKAQIVRITHNCEIIPKGLYSPLEDNTEEIELTEEFKMPEFGELVNTENWVHLNPYILKMGRSNYFTDSKLSEEQKDELLSRWAETDPKTQRLKPINQDRGLQKYGLEGCWSVRTYGPTQVFSNVGKEEGTTSCYGVIALRNPHWPGWVTAASQKEFSSIYIGYALKASQPSYSPLGPQELSQQTDEVDQFQEPNPRDPPDELEPDSDQENKKDEE